MQHTPAERALKTAVCDDPDCRQQARQRSAEQAHRLKVLRGEIEKRRRAWLKELRRQLRRERQGALPDAAEKWPLLLLPGNARSLQAVDDGRRAALRRHLRDTLAESQVLDEEAEAATDQPPETAEFIGLAAEACELCGGNCCAEGGDRAYINSETIARHRRAYPGRSNAEIEEAFLACVPDRTYADSCIFHGKQGCGLGEWRGPVCRGHFCPPLREAQTQGMARAWGVSLTAGEPHWSRWPWPDSDDEILGWRALGG